MANPIDYFGDISLHGGALREVAIEQVETLPVDNLVKGRIVLHDGKIKYYMGAGVGENGWVVIGSTKDVSDLADRVTTVEGQVTTLETDMGTAQTDITNLKRDKIDKTSIVTTLTGTFEDKVPSEKTVKDAIDKAITNVYKFAGTVPTYASLTAEGTAKPKVNGAVYNVEAQFEYDGKKYNAGTNVVYDEDSDKWEPLTGIMDTSDFQLISNLVTVLTGGEAGKYPSVSAVNAGLALKADKADTYTKTEVDTALGKKVDKLAVSPTGGAESATFTKVTINAQGQVTAGQAQIVVADISDFATEVAKVEVASAKKLASKQSFSITGGAEASAVQFDGTGEVALNVTSIKGASVSGLIPVASVPEIGISKITDFANEVKSVIRPQFVDVALDGAGVTAQGNKYTITTAGKAYGVMVLHSGVQVFVSTTVTDGNIVLDFNSAIAPAEFTVSYIQKF